MVFRFVIRKTRSGFEGICLETSLLVTGKTVSECKKNMKEAFEAYLEIVQSGENKRYELTPVRFYLFHKLKFDLMYKFIRSRRDKRRTLLQREELIINSGLA